MEQRELQLYLDEFLKYHNNDDWEAFANQGLRDFGVREAQHISQMLKKDLIQITNYYIEDDVVFSYDKKRLIKYSPERWAEEYCIPNFVENIDDKAFKGSRYLKKVVLSDNISHIGSRAFENCKQLCEVFLGHHKSMGSNVFVNCPKLKIVRVTELDSLWGCGCDNYGSPFINNAVLYINDEVCEKLVVPMDAKYVCWSIFKGCTSIKNIEFESNNECIINFLMQQIKN